jgi:hypothetical protein
MQPGLSTMRLQRLWVITLSPVLHMPSTVQTRCFTASRPDPQPTITRTTTHLRLEAHTALIHLRQQTLTALTALVTIRLPVLRMLCTLGTHCSIALEVMLLLLQPTIMPTTMQLRLRATVLAIIRSLVLRMPCTLETHCSTVFPVIPPLLTTPLTTTRMRLQAITELVAIKSVAVTNRRTKLLGKAESRILWRALGVLRVEDGVGDANKGYNKEIEYVVLNSETSSCNRCKCTVILLSDIV